MEDEKLKIIQQGIEANKQKFEIRKEIVGAGFPTDDFDTTYASVLATLGKQEPIAPKVILQTKTYIPPEFGGKTIQPLHVQGGLTAFQVVGIVLLLIALALGGLYAGAKFLLPTQTISNEPIQWGEDRVVEEKDIQALGAGDGILETKVKATVASAMLQGGRMGSYDGVCKDISVVAPVRCRQTTAGFIIYVPLSNGAYYCEDKLQNGKVVATAPLQAEMCQ